MQNKIIKEVTWLSEVTAEAKKTYEGYNLETSVLYYLGLCLSIKIVRRTNCMDDKIRLLKLITEAHELYRNN